MALFEKYFLCFKQFVELNNVSKNQHALLSIIYFLSFIKIPIPFSF